MYRFILALRDPAAGLIIGFNAASWPKLIMACLVWAAVSQVPLIIGGSHKIFASEKGVTPGQAFFPFYFLSFLYSSAVTGAIAALVFFLYRV